MKWIRKIWDSFETLDDRIFFLAVTVSMLLSIVVYIADIIAGLTLEAKNPVKEEEIRLSITKAEMKLSLSQTIQLYT